MRFVTLVAALLAAVPISGAVAQPATVQQEFDAATAALDARNWAEAVRRYEALEARIRNPRTLAIARTRRATALVELRRVDEAAALLRASLPSLSADDRSLDGDRFVGLVALGQIAESRLDYDEAQRQFRIAAAISIPEGERLPALRGLIQTRLFSDAQAALRDADVALRIAAAAAPANRVIEAQFHTLKGRALLNLGRFAEAQAELELAMRQFGGLTLRADMNDLVARSDLTIAALLAGQEDRARRYLAYTGAGRFQRGAPRPLYNIDMPPCGGELSPNDVAVIQLGLTGDGRVAYAMPIYASRQGPAALAFARAVTGWVFERRGTGGIPDLLRAAVRIEVRCSNLPLAEDVGEEENSPVQLLRADPVWARSLSANINRPTDALRVEAANLERDSAPGRRAALPLLLILAGRGDVPEAEKQLLLRRALAIAAAERAPATLVAGIAIAATRPASPRVVIANRTPTEALDVGAVLALPEVSDSPRVTAAVRLAQARHLYYRELLDEALAATAAALRALADAAPTDPLMVEARQLQVAAHAAAGNMAAASSTYEALGANAQRCGLTPLRRRITASSRDFPREALQWRFEGWAANELAVTPGGEVAEARTVMAYPPFVFGEAARRISARTRYYPAYVPDGAPCAYDRQRVIFALPRR